MPLYQNYETEILTENEIDLRDSATKQTIQRYDREQILQLPVEPLERIQQYLENYNYLTGNNFELRYYQILALLFTEQFFADHPQSVGQALDDEQEKQQMLAYWMATGSGKTADAGILDGDRKRTLVMHLNILQYLHHFCQKDGARLQIFLTTPLANLIKQHERELEPYIRQLNKTYNNRIELTIGTTQGLLQKSEDYFRLPDTGEIRRLILVDEAHIGLSNQQSGEFKKLRSRLNVGASFLFEYSATFHNLAKTLQEEYDNAIIYRYDYARFYSDGYGKDHFFKPIAADTVATESEKKIKDNLNECFAVMEDKLQTFRSLRSDAQFDIDLTTHRPLMAFMGHTVENPKAEGKDDEVSDIQKVLDYLASLNETERGRFRTVFGGDIIGPLVVARNPDNNNELLLSYGDGEKWGMINVGDATSFYNGITNDRIETRVETITNPNLHFENLDNETSPINVLIGSRKFAEGWNSYRLSVINLINLGSAKGNLIIQIFGRGVRLHGKGGDGKRRYIDHKPDYYLLSGDDPESKIRRLETLTVFSLRRSYLERFLKEVHAGGIPLLHTFKIKVNPMFFKLDDNTEVDFEEYRHKLHIFKQGNAIGKGVKRVTLNGGEICYTYFDGSTEKQNTINNWRVQLLDYRTDKEKTALDVYEDLRQYNEKYTRYLNRAKIAAIIQREARKNGLQLYNCHYGEPTISDFLSLVREIRYHKPDEDLIAWTDRLNRQIVIDVTQKLRNYINSHINRANYVYEPLNRDDFIYEYTVTKTFETRETYDTFLQQVQDAENQESRSTNPEISIRAQLTDVLGLKHRHIYKPLVLNPNLLTGNEFSAIKVSPDRLNAGERKFVEDLTAYLKLNYHQNKRYEFYLMRNVSKLGIYLESDSGSYYPDFVLWVLDKQQDITHILFIDPKGERDIIGGTKGDYKSHPKVKLARKSEDETLITLEKRLTAKEGRKFCLNSFLLLRDSSELGKNEPIEQVKENMLPYNVFRLDWHKEREDKSTSSPFNDEKSYLDLMFEKAGIRK